MCKADFMSTASGESKAVGFPLVFSLTVSEAGPLYVKYFRSAMFQWVLGWPPFF